MLKTSFRRGKKSFECIDEKMIGRCHVKVTVEMIKHKALPNGELIRLRGSFAEATGGFQNKYPIGKNKDRYEAAFRAACENAADKLLSF